MMTELSNSNSERKGKLSESEIERMQRKYLASFLKEKNSIALVSKLENSGEIKSSFLTEKYGIIEITTKIMGNPPTAKFRNLQVLDDGFMKIGFDRLSLMNLNSIFSSVETSIHS